MIQGNALADYFAKAFLKAFALAILMGAGGFLLGWWLRGAAHHW